MSERILNAAIAATTKYGLSVLPIAGHDWKDSRGTILAKKPCYQNGRGPKILEWSPYQSRCMTPEEIQTYFGSAGNIGFICGAVSQCLEVLDFDEPDIFDVWKAFMVEHGFNEIVDKLVIETSMRPGRRHAIYRWEGPAEQGFKLASRPSTEEELKEKPDEKRKCMIETRAEGQYFVGFPSDGYNIVQGSFANIPIFTSDERGAMLTAARLLTQIDDEEEPDYRPSVTRKSQGDERRPGSDFNERADWREILEPLGWSFGYTKGRLTTWVRPGKQRSDGISASSGLGRANQDLLRVYTTNGYPLQPATTYDKFGAFAMIHHGGDVSVAASALAKQGYGASPTKPKGAGELPASATGEPPVTNVSTFRFYTPSELAQMPPKPMLIEGLLGLTDRAMLYGIPGIGKTFVLTDLIISACVGGTFAETFECTRPLRVIYATNEGRYGYPARIRACLMHHGLSWKDIEENLVVCFDMPQLADPSSPRAIKKFAEGYKASVGPQADLLILDTLNKATLGSEENSNSDAAVSCDALNDVGIQLGVSTLLVHHPAHATAAPRGASAFVGDMDLIVRVAKEEGESFAMMHCFKGKDIPPFDDIAFKLEPGDRSAVVRWLADNDDSPGAHGLLTAIEYMASGNREWWTVADLAAVAGIRYQTLKQAVWRDQKLTIPVLERRGNEYRRRTRA